MKSEQKLKEVIRILNLDYKDDTRLQYCSEILHQFIIDNTPDKCKGAFDIRKWVSKDDFRPVMMGVFHDPSYKVAVATDSKILVASADDYKAEYAGQIIDKYDKPIDGKYPCWHSVIPDLAGYMPTPIDKVALNAMDKELEALKKECCEKIKKESTFAKVEVEKGSGVYVRLDYLLMLGTIADVVFYREPSRAVVVKTETKTAIAMPMLTEENKEFRVHFYINGTFAKGMDF